MVCSRGVVEGLKQRLDHPVQLLGPYLLLGRIVLERFSRLLSARSRLKRCLLKQQLFQIVGRVKVGLVARRDKDGRDLLPLQRDKIEGAEEGVVCKRLKTNGAYALLPVLLEQRADGMQAGHGHGRAGDGIRGLSL